MGGHVSVERGKSSEICQRGNMIQNNDGRQNQAKTIEVVLAETRATLHVAALPDLRENDCASVQLR